MAIFRLSPATKGKLNREAATLALEVREKLNLGYGPIDDMYELLESKGFILLSFPSKDDRLSGFHTKKSNRHCIYINSNHVLGRQHFSLAHELYHSFYDEDKYIVCYDNDESDDIYQSKEEAENEYRANCFAANFLMTEKEMLKFASMNINNPSNPTVNDIIRVQHHFSVSYKAALKRFCKVMGVHYPKEKKLAVYSLPEYKEELERLTLNLGFTTKLIKPTAARIPESFLDDISFNLAHGKISNEKAAELELLIKVVKG